MNSWHILTPELPPRCGGVGEYVASIAEALAAAGAASVTVWVPPAQLPWRAAPGVNVRMLSDRFGRSSMRTLSLALDREAAGARLLVQYVPNAFGQRGANLAFCRWLLHQRERGHEVLVMFHEPYLYYRWRPDHLAIALVQRRMAATLLRAASRLYLSTTTWRRYLEPLGRIDTALDLPIPSSIPFVTNPGAVEARRAALGRGGPIVGHFGTYGSHVAPLVRHALTSLLSRDRLAVATCAGANGDRFVADLVRREPGLSDRVHGPGRADAREIAIDLQSCDLVLQPYPDGVTTRRTSVMAALANKCPVLTTDGALTEEIWRSSGGVALAPAGALGAFTDRAATLLRDPGARATLAGRGARLYAERFDLALTIAALMSPAVAHA